jgi:BASS family bile acid:Na+ symporter
MVHRSFSLATVSHFVHKQVLWLLIGSYFLAGVFPALGLWLRRLPCGTVSAGSHRADITLPMVLLAWLLFNAGLGVQTTELRHLLRRPSMLLGGLFANVLCPVAFLFAIAQVLRLWHNAEEVHHILVGLALVAAMPIAGSSTAWSQNANGDIALSLGLVILSTFLSPLTTPVTIELVRHAAQGEYAQKLGTLQTGGTGMFLFLCVLLPSLLGIAAQHVASARLLRAVKPALKLINIANLLVLNYANASASLPQMVQSPDWDLLAITVAIVLGLCLVTFASGWGIAELLGAEPAQRTSLMFGLGMNNNGTGLVLAALAFPHCPRVMLPIIFYNLVQHLFAAVVDARLCRPAAVALSGESA